MRTRFASMALGLGATLLASACETMGDDAGMPEAVVRDSAGVTLVEHPGEVLDRAPPLELAPEPALRLGTVDGSPELQFATVTAGTRLDHGTIVIVDRQNASVRLFNADGRLLRSMDRQGDGPGEFRRPELLAVGPDGTLGVWDGLRRRLLLFDRDGELVADEAPTRELPVGWLQGFVLEAGDPAAPERELLFMWEARADRVEEGDEVRYRETAQLVRTAADGSADTLASFPGTTRILRTEYAAGGMVGISISSPWYAPRLLQALDAEALWHSDGTRWEASLRDPATGELGRIVRILQEPDPFTGARIEAMYDSVRARAVRAGRDPPDERSVRDREYPETVPPLAELFMDVERRLWFGELEVPPLNLPSAAGWQVQRWLVLDPAGEEVVGRVTLPPRSRLLHADADGVLLVVLDELDVPYVEWREWVEG